MTKVSQDVLIEFGKAVRESRERHCWTLDELVSKLGSGHKSFLSRIENGKRPNLGRRTVSRLIKALAPHLDAVWFDRFGDSDDTPDDPTPEDTAAEELVGRAQADPSAPHLAESLLITLAYEFAGNRNRTVDDAYRDLRRALEAAKRIIDRGAMPSNLDDAVKQVLAEVSRLVQAQDFDGAAEVTDRELARLADEAAKTTQAQLKLLDTALDLALSRNRPEDAAAHVLTRLRLEGPGDLFAALRAAFIEWYERGRDKGLSFDLEVAIRLARETVTLARSADQRGMALNDLGMALQVLGRHETGTERLTEAVAAYRLALQERRARTCRLTGPRRRTIWALRCKSLASARPAPSG